MMFIGIWLAGREYIDQLNQYLSYKYYHKQVTKNTKKAVKTSKELVLKTHGHVTRKSKKLIKTGKKVANRTKQVINTGKIFVKKGVNKRPIKLK